MATAPKAKKAAPKTAKPAVKKVAKKTVSKEGPFAVIATGGKQYMVRVGDIVTTEIMGNEMKAGDTVSFDQVLLIDNGSTTTIGKPTIPGALVTAEFIEQGRAQKIDVIKYQPKSRYYKKRGHRQPFIKVKIVGIK